MGRIPYHRKDSLLRIFLCKYLPLLFASFAATFALPVWAQTQPVHHIHTVFVIVMENHNWTGAASGNIKGNPEAPYINYTLLPMASHANAYSNPPGNHPSLPNYIWMEAGSNLGIKDDGPPSSHPQSTSHLTTLLEKAGVPWRAYEEDITGKTCPLIPEGPLDANGNQLYQPRHDPFVYFNDQTNSGSPLSTKCIQHVRPFPQLGTDLANNTVARFNFITPNLCDDMHDGCGGNSIAHGDTWLKNHVPAILNSTAYRSGGALFIVWDEAEAGNGPIPMIVLSPYAKGNGYHNSIGYTHSSLLRTTQEIFGVSPMIRNADAMPDLHDLFQVFP
jgi:phosphatidylinositol-3-phosphatase